MPFQVKSPINFNTIKKFNDAEQAAGIHKENDKLEICYEDEYRNIILKAKEEAETILSESQYEALRLIENTEAEVNENKKRIEEEAWQKGYGEGMKEAQRQYEGTLQEAEFIRENAKIEYKEVLAGMESDVVNTILEVARKVIGAEVSLNKENLIYLVKQAFEKCSSRENLVLKVSPDDYEFLTLNKDKLLSMVPGIGELEIKRDSSLDEGSCIVETPLGIVDAGIQIKLQKIEEAFRQTIGK
jgi:flagellar assembly protein FliH